MKNLIFLAVWGLFCISCEKDTFDIENPDVDKFVQQLKNSTYNKYELGENGEKLWTIMPKFKRKDIPLLLKHSLDTTLLSPWEHLPINPVSSIPPYRAVEGQTYIMLGEYLLWCVEGIIEEKDFASLTPILIRENNYTDEKKFTGKEILDVAKLYQSWWEEYGQTGNTNKLPLDGTIYRWR